MSHPRDGAPIIFSAAMVRALVAGRKTQTRRLLKRTGAVVAPRYAPGDLLWVRENLTVCSEGLKWTADGELCADLDDDRATDFWSRRAHKAGPDIRPTTVPSMYMPRWASRLTLEVTDVRVERVQDISREDAIAEGLRLASANIEEFYRWPEPLHGRLWLSPVEAYRWLWEKINGVSAWASNPWVCAVAFRVHRRNVAELLEARGSGEELLT